MSRLLSCALAALMLACPAIATAQFRSIGSPASPVMVGADKGWRVWSERRLFGPDLWQVVVRAPEGNVFSRPTVAQRAVPFDIDVGIDAGGEVVAAYSRCSDEPEASGGVNPFASGGLPQYTTGKDCSIRILDLTTGEERTIRRAGRNDSEVLPSIAGRRLAFVGTSEGGKGARRATLFVRDLVTGRDTRLFTGPRARGSVTTAVGPTSVDTDGRTVASAWRARDGRSFRSRVLVQRVSAAKPTVAGSAVDPPGTAFATVFGPTVVGRYVSFLHSFGHGFCERRFARRGARPAYGIQASRRTAAPVSAALDGDRLVIADVQADDRNPTEPGETGQIVEHSRRDYAARADGDERCG